MKDRSTKSALEQLGAAFKRKREDQGLSLSTVARKVGITANTLSRIEQGKFDWNTSITLKLSRALKENNHE